MIQDQPKRKAVLTIEFDTFSNLLCAMRDAEDIAKSFEDTIEKTGLIFNNKEGTHTFTLKVDGSANET
jgi:hypothetical protein